MDITLANRGSISQESIYTFSVANRNRLCLHATFYHFMACWSVMKYSFKFGHKITVRRFGLLLPLVPSADWVLHTHPLVTTQVFIRPDHVENFLCVLSIYEFLVLMLLTITNGVCSYEIFSIVIDRKNYYSGSKSGIFCVFI